MLASHFDFQIAYFLYLLLQFQEAEANPSHKLYALQDRFVEHLAVETAVEASKFKIAAFVEEHEKISNVFQR